MSGSNFLNLPSIMLSKNNRMRVLHKVVTLPFIARLSIFNSNLLTN